MGFNEVGNELPEVWTPEKEGDVIEGTLMRKKTNVGKNKANLYVINVDGILKSVWGSTVLDEKMDNVHTEDVVRITFLGNDEDKGYHKYKVEVNDLED